MKSKKNNYEKIEKGVFMQRVQDFYKPFTELFEEADVYRPEGKDFVYQMTGLQCFLTFVFMALWIVGFPLLHYILRFLDTFAGLIAFIITINTLPYVIEGPRFLLPWRCVQKHELYAVRWKSKWGFRLAIAFGLLVGCALSFSLPSFL